MGFLLRLFRKRRDTTLEQPVINPKRDHNLYRPTPEGYLIAQDISCQYEYVADAPCQHCNAHQLSVMAQINRSGQGLNELVCKCKQCGKPSSFIFDISNRAYQSWLAEQLGDLYMPSYDGPPRRPAR